MKTKKSKTFFFIVYLVFGLYFLNYPFQIFGSPEFIVNMEPWVIFVGGILMILGAVNVLRMKSYYR